MNRYVKAFFHRGLIFGGFGPVIVGIVYAILQRTLSDFSLSGGQVCLAIISTYVLAFLQAGASVFPQIEEWPLPKSLLCHFAILYVAYVGCYLINTWIPFIPMVVGIFTAIFAATYLLIWLTVYWIVRATGKKMTAALN